MRKACLDSVYELARQDSRIFFIGSDLGVGTLDRFKAEMPSRFFMEGVSEANIIGMAAGLALEGKIPYVNTIATFLTRRCFEQVVVDLCLHRANVRLLASGGGLVYAPLGPTHEAIEDISIMRSLPNMTVIAPADAREMKRMMPLTVDYQGPIYIRFGKGGDPIVTSEDVDYKIGKAVLMREGRDALLITTGITLQIALNAALALEPNGIRAGVLHLPTVKPLDTEAILKHSWRVDAVVTIEEHSIIGGLGSAIAEVLIESKTDSARAFRRMGIPDVFPDQYGSQKTLMSRYNLDVEGVTATVTTLLQGSKSELRTAVVESQ
jgi:transketolase